MGNLPKYKHHESYLILTDARTCDKIINSIDKNIDATEDSMFKSYLLFMGGFVPEVGALVSATSFILGMSAGKQRAYLKAERKVISEVRNELADRKIKSAKISISSTGTFDVRAHAYYWSFDVPRIVSREY